MKGFTLFIAVCLFASVVVCYEPKECSRPSDCAPNECCVLGMERYAVAQCKPMGIVGERCREEAEPENRMLFYPNLDIRYIEEMYTLFCPCQEPHVCMRNTCFAPFEEQQEDNDAAYDTAQGNED